MVWPTATPPMTTILPGRASRAAPSVAVRDLLGRSVTQSCHEQRRVELGSANADGVAEHLAGAQGARLFDVLAGDPAAAHDDEDLVLLGQFFEGLGVLLEALLHRGLPGWSRRENRRIS